MAQFSENNIPKAQRITGYVLSGFFTVQIFMAGIMKVIKAEPMVEAMNSVPNWGDKIIFVGILELVLLLMYWLPKTHKIGFYLLCSFVGGIIVAEVASGKAPIAGIVTAILLYAGEFLRYPSMAKSE